MATPTPLLTVPEAADRLAVIPARLKRWAKAGTVPSIRLPDGEYRFDPSDIDRWIGANRWAGEGGDRE